MKIPPQAKKVFTGEIFDVYHWDQEMFDGSHQTFEMLRRPDTTQVIATSGDKILMAYEEQPAKQGKYMTFFGGRIEKGEEPLAGAKRELLEESGMESNDWELFHTEVDFGKIEWTIFTYIARNCTKTAKQSLDVGEKITIKEFSFEEFIEACTAPGFVSVGMSMYLLRLQREPEKLEEFRKKIFGNI